jgi:hypothetical protein
MRNRGREQFQTDAVNQKGHYGQRKYDVVTPAQVYSIPLVRNHDATPVRHRNVPLLRILPINDENIQRQLRNEKQQDCGDLERENNPKKRDKIMIEIIFGGKEKNATPLESTEHIKPKHQTHEEQSRPSDVKDQRGAPEDDRRAAAVLAVDAHEHHEPEDPVESRHHNEDAENNQNG